MLNLIQPQLLDAAKIAPRILVVDDLADNCTLLQVLLEQEGYQVDTAEDGYTAIAKVERQPPSLMLLDVMMPDLDGYEVAQWVGHNQPNVPILLVTASCDLPTSSTIAPTIVGCLRKPLDTEDLMTKVNALIHD
jgi:CheY-like chemotaxis protein